MYKNIIKKIKNISFEKKIFLKKSKILLMGYTFKENCSDIRNSKVFDLIFKLNELNLIIEIYDPLVDFDQIKNLSNYKNFNQFENINSKYDAIIVTVAHDYFIKIDLKNIMRLFKPKRIIFDLKRVFPSKFSNLKL